MSEYILQTVRYEATRVVARPGTYTGYRAEFLEYRPKPMAQLNGIFNESAEGNASRHY